jgi:hypothetical protein
MEVDINGVLSDAMSRTFYVTLQINALMASSHYRFNNTDSGTHPVITLPTQI